MLKDEIKKYLPEEKINKDELNFCDNVNSKHYIIKTIPLKNIKRTVYTSVILYKLKIFFKIISKR